MNIAALFLCLLVATEVPPEASDAVSKSREAVSQAAAEPKKTLVQRLEKVKEGAVKEDDFAGAAAIKRYQQELASGTLSPTTEGLAIPEQGLGAIELYRQDLVTLSEQEKKKLLEALNKIKSDAASKEDFDRATEIKNFMETIEQSNDFLLSASVPQRDPIVGRFLVKWIEAKGKSGIAKYEFDAEGNVSKAGKPVGKWTKSGSKYILTFDDAARGSVAIHPPVEGNLVGEHTWANGSLSKWEGTRQGEGSDVDLLASFVPSAGTVAGIWSIDTDGLKNERTGTTISAIKFIDDLPGSYELHYRFKRLTTNECVALVFPVGDRTCSLLLSSEEGKVGGLSRIAGAALRPRTRPDWKKNPTNFTPSPLKNGVFQELTIRVQLAEKKSTINAELDGSPIVGWSGPTSSLAPEPYYSLGPNGRLGIATERGVQVIVAEAKVTTGQ